MLNSGEERGNLSYLNFVLRKELKNSLFSVGKLCNFSTTVQNMRALYGLDSSVTHVEE